MPFGLRKETATFQRLMAQALTKLSKKIGSLVMCFLDDVRTATSTLTDHTEVFDCMKRVDLKCKLSKCKTLRDLIKF